MNLKSKLNGSFFFVALICFYNVCFAEEKATSDTDAIKANIESILTDIKVDQITSSPVDTLYQVTAGPLVLYATKDGKYALTGDILDLKQGQTNLTEIARKKARVTALEKLGEKNMIVFTPEKVKSTVTVFTDIDCGYCRKFHAQMPKMMELGIKVRYVAFPRSGIGSRSFEKALAVWCSKNPADALTLAKQGKEIEEKAGCDKKALIEKEFNFGLMTGVMGTPTFILEDGTLIPGYLPPERLAELTEQIKAR